MRVTDSRLRPHERMLLCYRSSRSVGDYLLINRAFLLSLSEDALLS